MLVTIKKEVSRCEECPFHTSKRVYTGDSWDDCRDITCTKLDKVVFQWVDWYEKPPVSDECPFRE